MGDPVVFSEMRTRIDRHEHIGQGFIGETAFKLLVNDKRLQGIPFEKARF